MTLYNNKKTAFKNFLLHAWGYKEARNNLVWPTAEIVTEILM